MRNEAVNLHLRRRRTHTGWDSFPSEIQLKRIAETKRAHRG
ncbi:hypothetical protein EDD34_1700 [Myceligenerans xiligouense]|uniref:Uncharacterized protein n=1 Tax=Myceligenerans xiligouense TaxID=253184 RepID=A0A3N4Z707_9MICO|nr:hypothetical protein EDD34_1700 [Myceligenerans xiligouense]